MEKYRLFYESLEKILLKILKNPEINIKPAKMEEIDFLEKNLNLHLPLAYKAWLLKFGHSQMVADGLAYSIDSFLRAQREAEELNNDEDDLNGFNVNVHISDRKGEFIYIHFREEALVFTLLSNKNDDTNVYAYFGGDSLHLANLSFVEHIRESFLASLILGITNSNAKHILDVCPWLDIYELCDLNFMFDIRKKFLSSYSSINSFDRIAEFEELEIAFRNYYQNSISPLGGDMLG